MHNVRCSMHNVRCSMHNVRCSMVYNCMRYVPSAITRRTVEHKRSGTLTGLELAESIHVG